tara:strand:- start:19093 stop:20364 length:1272 start_codon:yes stop_codon:yes gene_type:complete
VATTYTRIKNRRGNKVDLPQPLADGEIGLALDTREVYIGAGSQDLLNTDVQVTPFLDAQSVVADDLGNLTSSSTNNGILNFNITGTEVLNPSSNVALAFSGNYGLPTGHPKLSGGLVASDLVVTKYLNGMPTTYNTSQYSLAFNGTTTYLNFTGSNIPEVGSKLLVTKWTKAQITEHVRARAGWEASDNTIASYDKWQYNKLATNQVYCDVSTGTGFVQFVTLTEKNALLVANANDSISTINEPSTYSFLGENSTIHTPVRDVEIDANLKIDLDTPEQAFNISNFINKKRGSVSRVASNIELFTEASYPRYLTNQYISHMQTKTLIKNKTTDTLIIEYPYAESNVYKIDYSLKFGSEFRTGTINITTDGTDTVINDSHVETGTTSEVTFHAAISSAKLQFNYQNANASTDANLSYKIERWLQA